MQYFFLQLRRGFGQPHRTWSNPLSLFKNRYGPDACM